ncbi:MAG: tetratricopeptide repeat protein [Candidatus Nitrosoglobus sp.]
MQTVCCLIQQLGRINQSFLTAWIKLFPIFILGNALLLGGILAANATAADQYLLTPSTYKTLSAVHKLLDKQQYALALKQLKTLQERVKGASRSKAYEQAVVLQTLGYAYSSMDDYSKAIQAFEASLDLEALPAQVIHDVRYSLAQIYMATEQYAKAAKSLEVWFKGAKAPPAEAHILAASAYYYLKQYTQAIPHIMAAIDLAKEPQESWYQLHLAVRLALKQYHHAAQVLEILISQFPEKEQYWTQLAAVYLEMSKEHQALAVQALTAHMRQLGGKELLRLADFYHYLNIPYKAAQVLQQGLRANTIKVSAKNWEHLANAWLAAREWKKAANAFSEAGRLRHDGKMDLRRGQIFIELQQWEQAGKAFEQALRKGGLDDPGQVRLFLGQVRYEQGRFADAVRALELARKSPNCSKQAMQWLKHLQMVQKQRIAGEG